MRMLPLYTSGVLLQRWSRIICGRPWIPAFAGMTMGRAGMTMENAGITIGGG